MWFQLIDAFSAERAQKAVFSQMPWGKGRRKDSITYYITVPYHEQIECILL